MQMPDVDNDRRRWSPGTGDEQRPIYRLKGVLRETTDRVTDDSQMCFFVPLISNVAAAETGATSQNARRTPSVSVAALGPSQRSLICFARSTAVLTEILKSMFELFFFVSREKIHAIRNSCRLENFHPLTI